MVATDKKPLNGDIVDADQERPSTLTWLFILLSGVISYGSYTTLVHLSMEDGKVPYSSMAVYGMTEFIKLIFCSLQLVRTRVEWNESLYFLCVPAFLYSINNNLAVTIQNHMDPATYQVLGNLKILISALLYRIVMKRPVRWLAMILLFLGGIFNCLGSLPAESSADSVLHLTAQGLFLVFLYSCISAAAAISTEYFYKQSQEISVYQQNVVLYFSMFVFNSISWLFFNRDTIELSSLLSGFNNYTWLLIATQVVSGLTMGFILKFGSNITRLFVVQSSILITTILSLLLFDLHLNLYFDLACLCVIFALALYYDVLSFGDRKM